MVSTNGRLRPHPLISAVTLGGILALGLAAPAAFAQGEPVPKVAVIDVQRILTDSKAGQDALAALKKLNEDKVAELEALRAEIDDLRSRIEEGRLSLSEERLTAMEKELEAKVINFRRHQDDADRELKQQRDEAFGQIERDVLPIINQVGTERGFTLIFNKFQSGLVFASEQVDITDQILERFDATAEQGS